ncbi:hypothetical protein IAR55_001411 [Kwoniella newhampshirensis]|uniref:Letm1 RBD domain-containing protein n=1 Tax=Kwoniella newhampshirensis TaxID=1651941 RepID=A0AAW0Z278_9TREE
MPSPPSSSSPSRPPETQIEVLYNTSVQSFVRRDHVKTQSTLKRLLDLLRAKRVAPKRQWYDLERTGHGDGESDTDIDMGVTTSDEDWLIKTLKLLISSSASLYTDPPAKVSGLPAELISLLPPTCPDRMLKHLEQVCSTAYISSSPSIQDSNPNILLPPQLLSTLILASLKLRPLLPSLGFAHTLTEDWLAALPDSFVFAISPRAVVTNGVGRGASKLDARERKRAESAREGYLKVVELFVCEVLAREGEWEMARGFLDGEVVMSSKRKEALFRHLRSLQTQSQTHSQTLRPAPSPSSSLVLPSDPPTSPSPHTNGTSSVSGRQRSSSVSSASTSSSEATARPPAQSQIRGLSMGQSDKSTVNLKGKGKETVVDDVEEEEETRRSSALARHPVMIIRSLLRSTLSYLPQSVSSSLTSLSKSNPYLLALPFPLILILLPSLIRRIRNRSRHRAVVFSSRTPTPTSSATALGSNSLAFVRARLELARTARGRGWWEWIWFYVKFWIDKFAGVWKLGTTITYV